jgi:glycerol-3-phosphate dehydrogenase (NAD(P)+)
MNAMKIAVIGAGSWGTAIARMLGQKHNNVCLWARDAKLVADLENTRQNNKYLPGVVLPETISFTADLRAAATGANLIVLVTPSHAMRQTAAQLANLTGDRTLIVTAAKGLETGTLKRMSEVITEEIPQVAQNIVVISGPNHAEEIGREQPSATVVASLSRSAAEQVQDIFMLPYFRVYTNPDVIGVEIAGALKNIIALGAGVAEGLGYGDNPQAALMTRGLAEIARLGVAMGALPPTFAGLAGIGDLIATCTSRHSRNRRAGIMFAEGKSIAEVEAATSMVVEGIRSTAAAYELAGRYDIQMPITQQIHKMLYKGRNPREAVVELMSRGKTHEVEEVVALANWER